MKRRHKNRITLSPRMSEIYFRAQRQKPPMERDISFLGQQYFLDDLIAAARSGQLSVEVLV